MIKPIVYIPLPSSLPYAARVIPHIIEIARTGVPFMHLDYGFTDRMRNEAARHLLESDYSHIVMLDSDHEHQPDIVKRLMYWIEQDPERQVVGGLNFKRLEPFTPCAWIDVDGRRAGLHDWGPGLIEVDAIGTGCIAISRDVFEAVAWPWFINEPDYEAKRLGSHDVYFSRKVRECGIRIWCDTAIQSPHIAEHTVGERSFRSWSELHPTPADQLTEVEV